ncbi:uncharacterized protein LY89DRAFT_293363, partial [Mollisia scopiformis]
YPSFSFNHCRILHAHPSLYSHTKKTTVLALFWIGYCVDNIIGTQTFQTKYASRFASAEITILVLFGIGLVDMLLMYFIFCCRTRRRNKRGLQVQT